MLRIGPDIFIILSTPNAPITILIIDIITALILYGSFPFDTSSKKLDPAVSKPIDVVKQAGAEVVGVGIVIEKGFQSGRAHLEDKGIRVESLVTIDKIEDGEVYFK